MYATFVFEPPHADQSRYKSGLTLPFDVWKWAREALISRADAALRPANWQVRELIELAPQSFWWYVSNWKSAVVGDILQLYHLCRLGALTLLPSLPPSLFHLRQLKYRPSPRVSASFNTWDGIGLRVHIWRVLLSIACSLHVAAQTADEESINPPPYPRSFFQSALVCTFCACREEIFKWWIGPIRAETLPTQT